MLRTAWAESPALALQLQTRFQLPTLSREFRWLLLNSPEIAIGEPDALQIMLENGLPSDVSYQLKVSCEARHKNMPNVPSIFSIGRQ